MLQNEGKRRKPVALVTGGASGIGRACAEALAAQGARVVVADLRAPEPVPAGMEVVQADLTTRAGCRAAVEETVRRAGGLDILVNNAGRQHLDPIAEFPEAVWDELVALMLTAPFLLTKYAWPHLERSGRGRVINVASVHALVASPYKAAYVSAKHGLLGLTRVAALEGGEAGITVNAVCPAYVRTPLVAGQVEEQARTRGLSAEEVERSVFLEQAAVKRLLEPEDVAAMVAFLASEAAWAVTGSCQTIDLGWTAR